MLCHLCGRAVIEFRGQVVIRSRARDITEPHGRAMASVPATVAEIRECKPCDWIAAGEVFEGVFFSDFDYIPLVWLQRRGYALREERERREGHRTPPHEPGE